MIIKAISGRFKSAAPEAGHMAFDYIIVGAGSAGCVLANRLTENSDCRVLLLEAGGEANTNLVEIPGAMLKLQNTSMDWAFQTIPQKHLFDRRIPYPRGRVVGGSSVLNFMTYIRGNRGDYDHWNQLGNTGWSYDGVLPYFIRAETNDTFHNEYHGAAGPLHVETHRIRPLICAKFIEAAQSVGIPFNPDFNGASQEGCGYYQATTKNGRRCSAAIAYIDPIRARKNLTIVKQALVTRLIAKKGRVRSVEYITNGHIENAYAEAEVICAAGAIGTPHLMMLSGLGPAEHLRQHGIEVIADLPGVGEDLQDHLGSLEIRVSVKDPDAVYGLRDDDFEYNVKRFERDGSGPLSTNQLESGAFLRGDIDDEYPSIQVTFTAGTAEFYRTDVFPDRRYFYLNSFVSRPRSRGSVTLASANPLDSPLIDPNYLSDPDDLRLSVIGIRRIAQIARAPSFDTIRTDEINPDPTKLSQRDLENFVRRSGSTTWHPTSTCRMGVDEKAVVDPQLRVRGVEGLRICDASIMPEMISGNTNAPVIMIAEKCSDLIRGRAFHSDLKIN
jgi:choline dehydrogenase